MIKTNSFDDSTIDAANFLNELELKARRDIDIGFNLLKDYYAQGTNSRVYFEFINTNSTVFMYSKDEWTIPIEKRYEYNLSFKYNKTMKI